MKKARKARKAKTPKKATNKKATKSKKAKKAKKAFGTKGRKAAKMAVAASSLGCCTIVYDNRPSESVPGVNRADCTRLARARGGVGQWNPGECA